MNLRVQQFSQSFFWCSFSFAGVSLVFFFFFQMSRTAIFHLLDKKFNQQFSLLISSKKIKWSYFTNIGYNYPMNYMLVLQWIQYLC